MTAARYLGAFVLLASAVVLPASRALAIHGTSPVNLSTYNGWQAFELVTQFDPLAGLADPGYTATAQRGLYDGLGTHVAGDKLSINVNHETADAAISRVDVSIDAVRQAIQSRRDAGITPFPSQLVTAMGYAYDRIYDGTYHAVTKPNPVAEGTPAIVTYGNANFDRFCSGTSYLPEAFGTGRGLVDAMYITGEEVSGGKYYAIDQVTRSMWEVPALGLAAWENAAQVDTGNTTHVALVLMPDVGSSPGETIRFYVGATGLDSNGDGTIDFLERNGLRGGTVYHFAPDPPASTTDLPDGMVTGKWGPTTTGALREDKLEDVHTNPLNGNQLVFTDQTDGVYRLDVPMQFTAGVFDPGLSPVTIKQIDDDDAPPLGAPDNLVWSKNGKIYVQEDGDGYEIWEIDEAGGSHVRVAQAFSEPSGVIDASAELGYEPGSILLSSIMGSGGSGGAQLVLLISPSAKPIGSPGDYNGNGVVDAADYTVWHDTFGSTTARFAGADGNGNSVVDTGDYGVWKTNFGAGATGSASASVPKPNMLLTAFLGFAVGLVTRRSRPRANP